jgi:hypothetical protein
VIFRHGEISSAPYGGHVQFVPKNKIRPLPFADEAGNRPVPGVAAPSALKT